MIKIVIESDHLMLHYPKDDFDDIDTAIRSKIKHAFACVEAIGTRLYGALEIISNDSLTENELDILAHFVSKEYEMDWGCLFAHEDIVRAKGKWLVSYNDCEFIRELYSDTISKRSSVLTTWRSGITAAKCIRSC